MASNPTSLKLAAFNDKDLLGIINDVADADGWADTLLIAERVMPSFVNNGRRAYALRCVGTRMSWMRRYGVVMRYQPKANEAEPEHAWWGLTEAGYAFMAGKLTAAQGRALDGLHEDQLLHLTAWLSQTYVTSSPVAATLIRRQMQYGQFARKAS